MTLFPIYEDPLQLHRIPAEGYPLYIGLHRIGGRYPLHEHDLAELTLVVEGGGAASVNGRTFRLRPGTALFLPPHHIHDFDRDSAAGIGLVCCMFDLDMLLGHIADPEIRFLWMREGEEALPAIDLGESDYRRMKDILGEMDREFHGSLPGRGSMLGIKLQEALVLLARAFAQASSVRAAGESRRKPGWSMVQYVQIHYMEEDLTPGRVGQRFKLGERAVKQSFRQLLGRSFLHYVQELRIRRAAVLLRTTEMTVAAVAAEVGFDSYRTFSRLFKAHKGMTPTEYRLSGPR